MKKNILVCLPSLASGDGIARFYMNYYDEVIKEYNVDFLCIQNNEYNKEYLEKIEDNKGSIFVCEQKNFFERYNYITNLMRKILQTKEYKIVHINLVNIPCLACIDACKNEKVIIHSHNPRTVLNVKTFMFDELAHFISKKKADIFFSCSEEAGKSCFGKNNFVTINNIIDVKKFEFSTENRQYIREKYNVDNDCFLVGVVGRITEQKNPFYLINIFERIKKTKNNSKLIWIGNGPLKQDISRFIEEKDLIDSVIFVEKSSVVERYYSAMDLFLLPSKFEGLGIVFIEAQANGLPTICSTNVPRITQITDIIFYENIKKNPEEWEEYINLNIATKKNINRKKYNEIVNNSVFSKKNINVLNKEYNKIINEVIEK